MIERLKKVINRVLPDLNLNNVNEDSKLHEDLGLDSIGMMMLGMALEDEFNIEFDEMVELNTVKDVINYLSQKGVK